MQDKIRENVNVVTVGLGLVQVIFIIFIVVAFMSVLRDDRVELGIGVSGLQQQIEGLPDSSKESIEYYIYQAVANNSASENVQKTGVIVRDGSLVDNYYEDLNIHYVNFIADLPDVGQSYQVFHEWSDDLKNEYISPDLATGVMCLDNEDLIYGDFECDHSNDYLRKAVAYNMIYKLGLMNTESGLSLQMLPESYASSPDFKVRIYYRECVKTCACATVSENKKTIALNAFDDFVSGLGLKPSSIPHYFDNCENGNM